MPGAACCATYPLLALTGRSFYFAARPGDGWAALAGWVREGRLERGIEPMPLWFLETLMLCGPGAAD